jgi:hypothetical protein
VVDATGTTVDNEAELMAASARLSWPLARGYLAVSVQDLMATDTVAVPLITKGRAIAGRQLGRFLTPEGRARLRDALVGCAVLLIAATTTGCASTSARQSPSAERAATPVAVVDGAGTVAGADFGVRVAVSGSTAIVGAPDYAKGAGAVFVFTKSATTGWTQTAKLDGSNTVAGDGFGTSVAFSDSTAVIGADGHGDYGAVYVFTETATGWTQTAELEGSDSVINDEFGAAVAISGDIIVVGALGGDGNAYVFTKMASGWTQAAELSGAESTSVSVFGDSVSISGTTVLVGADEEGQNQAGAVYVFTQRVTGWRQTAEFKGSGKDGGFGASVALEGDTAVVGASDEHDGVGAAYVFTKTGSGWSRSPRSRVPSRPLIATSGGRCQSRAAPPSLELMATTRSPVTPMCSRRAPTGGCRPAV